MIYVVIFQPCGRRHRFSRLRLAPAGHVKSFGAPAKFFMTFQQKQGIGSN